METGWSPGWQHSAKIVGASGGSAVIQTTGSFAGVKADNHSALHKDSCQDLSR